MKIDLTTPFGSGSDSPVTIMYTDADGIDHSVVVIPLTNTVSNTSIISGNRTLIIIYCCLGDYYVVGYAVLRELSADAVRVRYSELRDDCNCCDG